MFRITGIAALLSGVSAVAGHAATTGNDILFFQSTPTVLGAETIIGPSGGSVTRKAGTYGVNTLPAGYDGLAGTDLLFMTNSSDLIDERGGDVLNSTEVIFAGDGHDVILYDQPNTPDSPGGQNEIDAGGGDDIVIDVGAGATHERITARAGDDFVDAGAGDDSVDPGSGNDTVYLGAGDDVALFNAFAGSIGHNDIHLTSGFDTIEFGSNSQAVFGDILNVVSARSGNRVTTQFDVSGLGSITLHETLVPGDGLLDLFVFSDGSRYSRDSVLGAVPGISGVVPLPASALLLLSGLALGVGIGRRRRAASSGRPWRTPRDRRYPVSGRRRGSPRPVT